MELACVWCKREGKAETGAPDAVVGICEDHRARFLAEVEAALKPAPSAQPGRRSRRAVDPALVTQVADALRAKPCVDLCDVCLAADLNTRVSLVEEAIARLGTSPEFLRDTWRCARCNTQTLVTRARPRASGPASDNTRVA